MNKRLILFVFLSLVSSYSKALEDSTSAKIEIFECYERYDLKNQWAQVIELVSIITKDHPIDMTTLIDATGDYPFAYVKQENIKMFDSLTNLPEVKQLLPTDLRFVWSLKTEDRAWENNYYSVHAVKLTRQGAGVLNGNHILKAEAGFSETNQTAIITITMTPNGTKLWTEITQKNLNRVLVIVINNKVFSAPRVYTAITDSKTEISGVFTKEEAEAFAASINVELSNTIKKEK